MGTQIGIGRTAPQPRLTARVVLAGIAAAALLILAWPHPALATYVGPGAGSAWITSFHGQVTDPARAGVTVTVYQRHWDAFNPVQDPWVAVTTTTTASDGSFRIGPFSCADPYATRFTFGFKDRTPDYGETYWRRGARGVSSIYSADDVGPSDDSAISVGMVGPSTVRGTVVGRNGAVVIAGVELLRSDGVCVGSAGTSMIDGTFVIGGVFPGTYTVRADEWYRSNQYLATYAPSAADATSAQRYTVGTGETLDVGITMQLTSVFQGTLRLPDGSPAPHVLANLYTVNEATGQWDRVPNPPNLVPETDGAGYWVFAGLTAGTYRLAYEPEYPQPGNAISTFHGGGSSIAAAADIVIGDGEMVTVDDTATIGGEVHVSCWYGGALLTPISCDLYKRDATGSWQVYRTVHQDWPTGFFAIPPGSYRVSNLPPGEDGWGKHMRPVFYPDSPTVEGAQDIVVTAGSKISLETTSHPCEAISGSVISALTSEGIPSVDVRLWRRSAGGSWTQYAVQSSLAEYLPFGGFDFEYLDQGTYRLTLHDPQGAYADLGYPAGHGVEDAADIVIARDSRIIVSPAMQPVLGTVSGVVRDLITGDPLPGVSINLSVVHRNHTASIVPSLTVTTDDEGRYSIDWEAGQVTVVASDPAGRHTPSNIVWSGSGPQWIGLTPGAHVNCDIDLQTRTWIHGTVVDAVTQKPLAGMIVGWPAGNATQTVTSFDGSFSAFVDPGTGWASVRDPRGNYIAYSEYRTFAAGADVAFSVALARDPNAAHDHLPPVTRCDAHASYWGTATVSVSATDNAGGVGVEHTYVVLDGTAQVETTSVSVSSIGTHTIEFWSVDRDGNQELPHSSVTFQMHAPDNDAPQTSSNVTGSYRAPAQISVTATDGAGSGIAQTYCRLDGDATMTLALRVASEGVHTLEYWSIDRAGNEESPHRFATFTVDLPSAIVSKPSAPSSVRRGRTFSVKGYVAPRHTSGTYLATLYFYRLEHGHYVLRKTVKAKRSYYSSSKTKYAASTSLPTTGKWRVRAVHADDYHTTSRSPYSYIMVR